MTPAVTLPPDAPPGDPVREALTDAVVRNELLHHAEAILARRLVGRPAAVRSEAAIDAVQETQLRAMQKGNTYDAAAGSVRAWLHGIMGQVSVKGSHLDLP